MTLHAVPSPDRETLTADQINGLWNTRRREMLGHVVEGITPSPTIQRMLMADSLKVNDMRRLRREVSETLNHWRAVAAWVDEINAEIDHLGRKAP